MLAAGTTLGPYTILAPLGAGGMGEVYRARDPRLERDIALKVLPESYTADETARARLIREARSAAALSHPNICTVHEVGQADGHVYTAMELVEGQPLSVRIGGKPMPAESVIRYGAQIAEALAHAHERHVIHRDLKSGNVMITPEGRVKVLDFGLAKRVWEVDEHGPTQPQVTLTETGAVVGTPHYLAPEVLRGSKADTVSDVWALGVVLYEMAAGELPFRGRTTHELSAAILNQTPAPLPASVPAGIRWVIEGCLAKVPGERTQQAREVRAALEALRTDAESVPQSVPPGGLARTSWTGKKPGAPVFVTKANRLGGMSRILLAGGIVLIAVLAPVLLLRKSPPQPNPNIHTRTFDLPYSDLGCPGLSRDGRWIALPARGERGVAGLYLMNASGGEMRPIVVDSTADVYDADISPDGSQVVYADGDGILVVPALGGSPRKVAFEAAAPQWSPDGSRIGYIGSAMHRKTAFWTVRSDGSNRRLEFADSTSEVGFAHEGFAWSPDGKHIAWLRNYAHASYNAIVIHDLATGHERRLTHSREVIGLDDKDGTSISPGAIAWTKQDEIIFSSDRGGARNLWMVRASGGPAVQLTRGSGPDGFLRVSADGRTLLYVVNRELASVGWWNVETGENGRVTHGEEAFALPLAPSPDGQQVALRVLDPDAGWSASTLVAMNRDGSGRHAVVAGDEQPKAYDWSPDGRYIAWDAVHFGGGDSLDRHIADSHTGETQESTVIPTLGAYGWMTWISPDTIMSYDNYGAIWYSIARRGVVNRTTDTSPDHSAPTPNRVPGWTTIQRYGDREHAGVYVRSDRGGPERLVMPLAWKCGNLGLSSFFYCWPESLGFRRLDLPSGRLSRVPYGPPEGKAWFRPTRDGSTVFWLKEHDDSKLVLIENLHN